MAKYLNKPVAYLETTDFDKHGNLIARGIRRDVPVVIMLQYSWCPHCKSAKPDFQVFANETEGDVFCATIQVDGDRESEKDIGKKVKTLKPKFRGFPDYLLYKNGKRIDREIQGRSIQHLRAFSRI
jgi:thiol-disulfide isomerase/thioredoxin